MNQLEVQQIECPHCIWMTAKGLFHNKVCRCSHHHAIHVLFGGCTEPGCLCDRYDQSIAMRLPKALEVDVEPKEPKQRVKVLEAASLIDVAALEAQVADSNPDSLAKVQARVDELKKKVANNA